ncbi:hypothetical protein BDP27DRAFT_1364578 [Rhodocollybia butyracea]|uniref:Uncharacterized protein n=1 Tax=Rhodocollybia butyracea TaxID=206335 RepID=A0A9P5PR27_9AGAR|nr:hypothetical protein BDP27DRAFT_1364578 [Rhodocollybia butyracea]
MDRLYHEYTYTYKDTSKTKGIAKRVAVFQLSNSALQIILSSAGLIVMHISKNSELTYWTLSDIMGTALRVTLPTDPEALKFNRRLADKFKYCKEVLVISGRLVPQQEETPFLCLGPSGLGSSVASLNP